MKNKHSLKCLFNKDGKNIIPSISKLLYSRNCQIIAQNTQMQNYTDFTIL